MFIYSLNKILFQPLVTCFPFFHLANQNEFSPCVMCDLLAELRKQLFLTFFLSLSSRHRTGCILWESEWLGKKTGEFYPQMKQHIFCVTDQGYNIVLLL